MHLKLLLLVHTLLRKYIRKVKSMPLFIQWEDEQVTGKVSNMLQGNVQHIAFLLSTKETVLHRQIHTPSLASWVTECLTSQPVLHILWHLVQSQEVSQKI